ncbi:XRE family transcriptional regulator [Brucella endophytica]|nr:XRE family transcriptional regulator [Brucella endophytica]
MKPEDFTAWRERMGFNRVQAAEALGLSRNMPQRYEDGAAEIPLYIALACAALIRGIAPWPK